MNMNTLRLTRDLQRVPAKPGRAATHIGPQASGDQYCLLESRTTELKFCQWYCTKIRASVKMGFFF